MTSDGETVQAIRSILEAGHSDAFTVHLIREMFPRQEPNPIQFRGAVVELPDEGSWTDTGSGRGYDERQGGHELPLD